MRRSLHRKLSTPARLAALLMLMLLVTACGQKGGLYIPQEDPGAAPAGQAAAQSAVSPAPPPQSAPGDTPGAESEEE